MIEGTVKMFNRFKGYGFITGDDKQNYFLHFSELQGIKEVAEGDRVSIAESGRNEKGMYAKNVRLLSHMESTSITKVAPYKFVPRRIPNKTSPERRHERRNENCLDIAFEVAWTALTPVAANPCQDSGPDHVLPEDDKVYRGFGKRWLMIDNKLALSPFTVKSAIANGFAAIMGSCYRVINKIEGHPANADRHKYNYNGLWKRYRVSMNRSKPGILRAINAKGEVIIEPVSEYYYDSADATPIINLKLEKGSQCIATYRLVDRRGNPPPPQKKDDPANKLIIETLMPDRKVLNPGEVRLTYYGEYRFGMDLTLGPGELGKGHYHRFYSEPGKTITGKLITLNLETRPEQAANVYMGVFTRLDNRDTKRSNPEAMQWHQDLSDTPNGLHSGDWIYFQDFGTQVAIGKNFQFKTAFAHTDAVPEGQSACNKLHELCPRCALFGMTDKSGDPQREAIGFKGRFKASALVCQKTIECPEATESNDTIPVWTETGLKQQSVTVPVWIAEGEEIARQMLLPLMGAPKPNKRDVKDGYFNHLTGMLRGSKQYRHAGVRYDALIVKIKDLDQWRTIDRKKTDEESGDDNMKYSHELRNYAQVCRDGLTFTGTIGIENASPAEIAALLLLLEAQLAGHGFKVGLGKPLELGSMRSTVEAIWIRQANWSWVREPCTSADERAFLERVKELLPDVGKEIETLKSVHNAINNLNLFAGWEEREADYPLPTGGKYWEAFNNLERNR